MNDYLGNFPIDIEIVVIHADPNQKLKLDFIIPPILDGCEIIKNNNIVSEQNDLNVGDNVIVCGLFGEDIQMIITELNTNEGSAENDNLWAILKFNLDPIKAWICTGLVNKMAITSLESIIK